MSTLEPPPDTASILKQIISFAGNLVLYFIEFALSTGVIFGLAYISDYLFTFSPSTGRFGGNVNLDRIKFGTVVLTVVHGIIAVILSPWPFGLRLVASVAGMAAAILGTAIGVLVPLAIWGRFFEGAETWDGELESSANAEDEGAGQMGKYEPVAAEEGPGQ